MSEILGNPILLMSVLSNLTSATDIASICILDQGIRATALSVLRFSGISRLDFNGRGRLKSKDLTIAPFDVLKWSDLCILNLSGTRITAQIVRKLVLDSTNLTVLQIVDCRKVEYAMLMSLLKSISSARFGKRQAPEFSFAPLKVLDCWGVSGLSLDYKFQNKQEWMYESCCADNKNLRLLLFEAELLGIDLNINFCQSPDHDNVTDIRYHPAARQLCGLTPCTFFADHAVSYCDTCILREHNRQGNKRHKCRAQELISVMNLN